jgi:uncharacterized protein (TIGR03663 family)
VTETAAGPLPRALRSLGWVARAHAWAVASWRELAPFTIVAAVALVLRLPLLADKPFHHDESEHAWFAWKIVTGQGYEYDPVFHGPVQFYLPSLVYLIAGVGDYTARVAPALVGTAATLLPFLLRRQLGQAAAVVTSVVICLSPSFLYFSRFAREDIYVAVATLALVAAVFRFLDRPRPWHPSVVLGLLAVSFATKETTYITAFVGGTFFAGVLARDLWLARSAGARLREAALLRTLAVGRDAWIWGVATFATVFTLLFTSFFTNPRGLEDGLTDSIGYWLSQQPVNRGSQPWFYYLVVLPGYEWPVLLLAAIGIASVLRRPTLFGSFLVWMFACSLAVYSWASERMPWLILHTLLPLCLLAGIGGAALWRNRRRLVGRLGLLGAAVGAVFAVNAAFQLSYVRPADPRELLVFTQTSTDVPKVRDELLALERRSLEAHGRPLSVEVDGWGGTGWPWGWYLRDVPAGYPDMSVPGYVPTADVVIVAEPNHELVRGRLEGYVARRFRLRVWWVPDWGAAGVGDWARWLLLREPWSPTASMDEFLYVRRDIAPLRASR